MKKFYSLFKACMTSDMSLFKIKTKKNSKKTILIPIFISLYLMFMIWTSANSMFEKLYPMHISYVLLSLFVVGISLMTLIEGVYKSGPLIFNCKDDWLLLSLPIKRKNVLFMRILKFYIFELLFNSLFLVPIMIAYIRWSDNLNWTYFLTSFIMLFMLPIIPIVLSCFIGFITSSLSSKFKHMNIVQIFLSMLFLVGILFISFYTESIFNYIIEHSNSLNNIITKIYYPAYIYAKLVVDFNIVDLLIFILMHLGILILTITILGRRYFKINSQIKKVSTNKNISVSDLIIKKKSPIKSIVKKELSTFFKTPVFIINAGFALLLFIIATIIITLKFDSIISMLIKENILGIDTNLIENNLSIFVFIIISITAYMTSITNSVISLEGKNINILKSLPIKVKTILMGKVFAALSITTPILLIGDLVLFIVMKINIIDAILLILLSILVPLVSHFIGIIVNLKYPKFDWTSSTEVVKQSVSSFISVMLGIVLLIINIAIIISIIGKISVTLLLIIIIITYIIIDSLLYIYLVNKSVKDFKSLVV